MRADLSVQRQGAVHAYGLIQQRSLARFLQVSSLLEPSPSFKSVPQVGPSRSLPIGPNSSFIEGEIVFL